jgi:predicted protein tyrosine phosphatase
MNILFVCKMNKLRSLTAEHIYQNDPRFTVKSAGTEITAQTTLSRELLDWADWIIGMEHFHIREIKNLFPDYQAVNEIIALDIPDAYNYMQAELIAILQEKFESVYKNRIMKSMA